MSKKICYNPGNSILLFRRLVLLFRVLDKTRKNAARIVSGTGQYLWLARDRKYSIRDKDFLNCLDSGQKVFLRAFHTGQPPFLPIFFINCYVEFEIYVILM